MPSPRVTLYARTNPKKDLNQNNSHDKSKLKAIATEYKPPTTAQPRKKARNKYTLTRNITQNNEIPENLFEEDNTFSEEYKPFACILCTYLVACHTNLRGRSHQQGATALRTKLANI